MGDFTLSGNANIGLTSPVEFSVGVNSSKNNSIFYTTPTTGQETNLLQTSSRNAMQDELVEKTSVSSSSVSVDEVGSATVPVDKVAQLSAKECDSLSTSGLSDKLNEQVPQATSVQNTAKTTSVMQLGGAFHVSEGSSNVLSSNNTSSTALWSSSIEDGYVHNMQQSNVNGGGLAFQNFVSYNNSVSQGNQASGRRAITATHNFPHAMGRQQGPPSHPMYKGYSAWPNPPQQQGSWSGGGATAAWSRGRSVPNLNPMQQIGGLVNRKPSPTFSHQHSNMVISPVKFRRSTSYPGKGMFSQPPTFEITNMDDNRDLLPYQVIDPRVSHTHSRAGSMCHTYSYIHICVGSCLLPHKNTCTTPTTTPQRRVSVLVLYIRSICYRWSSI